MYIQYLHLKASRRFVHRSPPPSKCPICFFVPPSWWWPHFQSLCQCHLSLSSQSFAHFNPSVTSSPPSCPPTTLIPNFTAVLWFRRLQQHVRQHWSVQKPLLNESCRQVTGQTSVLWKFFLILYIGHLKEEDCRDPGSLFCDCYWNKEYVCDPPSNDQELQGYQHKL